MRKCMYVVFLLVLFLSLTTLTSCENEKEEHSTMCPATQEKCD